MVEGGGQQIFCIFCASKRIHVSAKGLLPPGQVTLLPGIMSIIVQVFGGLQIGVGVGVVKGWMSMMVEKVSMRAFCLSPIAPTMVS